MPYVRRISAADAVDVGYPNYRVVMAAGQESATVLGCFLGDSGCPPLHVDDVDLFYVVMEGSAAVQLAHATHQAKAGEIIYIPVGLPHGSHNQSGAAERHLEILVPGARPGAALLTPLESVDEVQLPATAPYVKSILSPTTETTSRERRWVLADEIDRRPHRPDRAGRARAAGPARAAQARHRRHHPRPAKYRDRRPVGYCLSRSSNGHPSRRAVRYLDADVQAPAAYAKLSSPA
jgi:mannose-6-phosphate isomerase-like protein (cupin superfamily)